LNTDHGQLTTDNLWLGRRINLEEHLPELDRLLVFHLDLDDDAGAVGGDLIEDLHRFDDADHGGGGDARADLDERLGIGAGGGIEGADHGALDLDEGLGWGLVGGRFGGGREGRQRRRRGGGGRRLDRDAVRAAPQPDAQI